MKSERHMKISIWCNVNRSIGEVYEYFDLYEEYANLLHKSTGITFEILDKVDLGFNKKHPNGSWTGMVGMVQRGEADVALSGLIINEERLEAVDFTYPFQINEFTFVTKHPEYSPGMFAVFYPFDLSIWITLMSFLIAITLTSAVIFNKRYSLVTLLFNYFAAITGQGSRMKFQNLHCRLQYFSWILGMVFLANCYKSVLLSFLTLPALKGVTDFKELTEAVEMGKYQCVVSKHSILPHMLMNSDVKSLRILGQNIHYSPIGYGSDEVLFQNPLGNIAFIGSKSTLTYLSRKLFISNDVFYPTLFGHAVSKTFCCKKELDKAVVRITDSGLFWKFYNNIEFRKSLRKFSSESNEEKATLRKLSLFEVSGVFIILICGYLIAACVLAIEILHNKYI